LRGPKTIQHGERAIALGDGPFLLGRIASSRASDAGPAQYAIDFGDHPLGLLEVFGLSEIRVQGDEEDYAEGVRPQIAPAIRPDLLRAHPIEFAQDMVCIRRERRWRMPNHLIPRRGRCPDSESATFPSST